MELLGRFVIAILTGLLTGPIKQSTILDKQI